MTYFLLQVNPKDGWQCLVMRKIISKTGKVELEDKVSCIHTALLDIPVDDFGEVTKQANFEQDMLSIRSSEGLREIYLPVEEKFIALSSWVAGIAEAGKNAFRIQAEIEAYARLEYPFTCRLLNFAVSVDRVFLPKYLQMVIRECRYDGVLHFASLRANLAPIFEIIRNLPEDFPGADHILDEMCGFIEDEEASTEANRALAELWCNLGYAFDLLRNYQKGIQAYIRALILFPTYRWAHENLGIDLIHIRDFARAENIFTEILAWEPFNEVCWNHLAEVYLTVDNIATAEHACRKSISSRYENQMAWHILSLIFWKRGKHGDAVDA